MSKFSPGGYIRSIARDARASLARVAGDRSALATIVLLVLPWWTLIFLRSNNDWLGSFGGTLVIVFAFWWMSRSGGATPPEIKHPRTETLFALALIVFWMVWRVGICARLFPFVPANADCFKGLELATLPKFVALVVLPVAVLFAVGYRWRAQGLDLNLRGWWISLPAVIGFLAYGLHAYSGHRLGFAQSTVEYLFGAGLPEEILFRGILLTRLEAWWRNSAWALFGSSVIFALSHLPVDFLVLTSRDWRETWIAMLTFQMGMGAAIAFAYQRTRNVWPIALLHAILDAE